ncbi:hypothetical protein D6774_00310 [Candidatus Woesearchaeota archaeon]|nr:MAG: hypothetical protein D6774_00310 [Candidatus Woesearchaeota archaeon]
MKRIHKKGSLFTILLDFILIIALTTAFISLQSSISPLLEGNNAKIGDKQYALLNIYQEEVVYRTQLEATGFIAAEQALLDLARYGGAQCRAHKGFTILSEHCTPSRELFYEQLVRNTHQKLTNQIKNIQTPLFSYTLYNNTLYAAAKTPVRMSSNSCQIIYAQDITKEEAKQLISQLTQKYFPQGEVDEYLIQAIAEKESGLTHSTNGFITTNHNPTSCDVGLMQINLGLKDRTACYDPSAPKEGSLCNVEECQGTTVADPACNIAAALQLLKQNYKETYPQEALENPVYKCDEFPQIKEKYAQYKGWDVALRLYNGPSCDATRFNTDYVEDIKQRAQELRTQGGTI